MPSWSGFGEGQKLRLTSVTKKYHIPWFKDLNQLRNELDVDAAIVSVAHPAHGALGFFNWSSIAYESALRWQRSTRSFAAERGMGVDDRLSTLTVDGKYPPLIEIKRYFHNVGGMETLAELVALTSPEIVWRNPFQGYYMDDETITVAGCFMSLVHAIRNDKPSEYGPVQARLDQELTLAMHECIWKSGAHVSLPLQNELG